MELPRSTVNRHVEDLEKEITRLKKEIKHLKDRDGEANEAKFSAAFESNPQPLMLSLKEDGTILDVNEAFSKHFGWNRYEILGKATQSLNFYINPQVREEMVSKVRPFGYLSNFETTVRTKSGKERIALISAQVLPDKHDKILLTHIQDITDIRRSENEWKLEHGILQAVIGNIGVGVVVSDAYGNILSLNKAAADIHDFADEKEGMFHLNKYTEEFELYFVDNTLVPFEKWPLALALRNEYVKKYQLKLLRKKSNTWRIISYNTVPVFNSAGDLTYIALTLTDLTEIEERNQSLAYERALFESIFDNIPVMVNIYDHELNNFRFNKAHREILGWNEADAANGQFMEKVYPDPSYRQKVTGYMKSLQKGWKEWHVSAKDGNLVESEWANIPIQNGIQIGIGIDIRQRKRSEQKIRENEQRLQGIFNSAAIGIVEADHEDRIIRLNHRVCEILGYHEEELLGKTVHHITHPDDRLLSNEMNRRLHSGELSIFNYEKRYVKKDGNPLWVHVSVSAITNEKGEHVRSVGTIEDISERKEAEKKLMMALSEAEEGKNILTALMDYIPLGITIAEAPECNMRMVSKYGLMMLQQDTDQLKPAANGQPSFPVFHYPGGKKPARGKELPLIRAILNKEIIKNEEWALVQKDGTVIPILCNAAPIYDRNGDVIGGVIGWQDITEQKRIENEIKQKNEELTRFIYTVSHDLKSPLVTIKSFTEYLKEDIQSNDLQAQEKDMKYICNAADKMGKLLEELLQLSRIGRKEEPKESIALDKIVDAALKLVAGSIVNNHVEIRFNCVPVKIHGHTNRLIQLFQNLIDNAVKYRGDQQKPIVEIGTVFHEDRHELAFYVKDNGIGIDPRYHHKIFGLFEKLDNTTEGTGIGLALVKRIVEFHGGKIWFESEGNGKGTTFYFTIHDAHISN